nr:RNA-directed DNA polymerase, eukaryota [Tanacetum cinerariifolium]
MNDGLEVTQKGKGKHASKRQHIDGVRLTKPKPNSFNRPVGKSTNVHAEASTSEPEESVHTSTQLAAKKMSALFVSSLRRDVRGGEESAQLSRISDLLDTVVLSNMGDRRFWDLNGDGCFRVKYVRRMLDDMLLPKSDVPSIWVKQIPIKVNVLAWKISMDRLPTR